MSAVTRELLHEGLCGGDLEDVRPINAVTVSRDPVAADAWAVALLGAVPVRRGWLLQLG